MLRVRFRWVRAVRDRLPAAAVGFANQIDPLCWAHGPLRWALGPLGPLRWVRAAVYGLCIERLYG